MTYEEERVEVNRHIEWAKTLTKENFNCEKEDGRFGAWIKKEGEEVFLSLKVTPHTTETAGKHVVAGLLCEGKPTPRDLGYLAAMLYRLFDKPLLINAEEAAE